MNFTHLHVHSHYSILDGMSKIPELISICKQTGMNAMALTDHGDMFGIKEFIDAAEKENSKVKAQIKTLEDEKNAPEIGPERKSEIDNEIESAKQQFFKPIIGVEAYCARRGLELKDKDFKVVNPKTGKEQIVDRSGYHLILLAKNKKGYQNLCKLVSISWIKGFYDRPRIDKKLLEKYHEGLIVSTACLGGEIPQLIMAGNIDGATKAIQWYKNIFGDDFYLEVQNHQTDKPGGDQSTYLKQREVNKVIFELGEKTNTKVIATNDVHFAREEYGEAHDRLICLSTGTYVDEPNRLHYTKQEWLKSPEQMYERFGKDENGRKALENTMEIADKIEFYSINSDPIMPKYDIPKEFGTEEEYRQKFTEQNLFDEFTRDEKGNEVLKKEEAEKKIKKIGGYDKLYRIKLEADYLAKLTWEGAKKRYGENISDEVKERIIFELHVMKTMGFPGYFLIVQDYIKAARKMGVSVGPGRGSAAGSVVAYCLTITDIDPLKYDLLFERFLNPDRISMPDIDVDFDDDGRAEVLKYVIGKYGEDRVAHIITYGTMATKSSIKDVGRVQRVPLSVVNQITSYVPDKFGDNIKDAKTGKIPKVNVNTCLKYVPEMKDALEGDDPNVSTMLTYAEELEDTIRQVGIHACGVIIGADDLTNFAPLATVKDRDSKEDVRVTQYDGHVVEQVGLIKMDFLGLKTLSIIKEALSNIKKSRGIDLDIDKIPIDDAETYELYSNGNTVGTFQFESAGMQKYLKELKPSVFEDLIAMNALYRPGPMDYIPQFIARKHGKEPITYDIPVMSKYLKDTYGITVYQEQVMLLSRLLANFTRGESDALRKAMGKKQKAVLDKLKPKFIEGGKANGHKADVLEKIWKDWEKFASYAFNKSHATCYSWVSYQTAYLKAHYPAEFMAANLTRNLDNITEITKFMDECKSMKLDVKGPDVNESNMNFTVNKNGIIRFGLGGIKGVGGGAVEAIVNERSANGPYTDIFNFVERVNLNACNRRALESLALSGSFDSFKDLKREDFFTVNAKNEVFIDELIKYGNRYQDEKNQNQNSLFGDFGDVGIAKPKIVEAAEWSMLEKLNKEKDLIGIYLSSHPLDKYRLEIEYGCKNHLTDINELLANRQITDFVCGGMVVKARKGISKNNNKYGIITLEDYSGTHEFPLFGNDYFDYGKFLEENIFIIISGKIEYWESKWKKADSNVDNTPKKLHLKITNIQPIDQVKDQLFSTINIKIPVENLDKMFCNDFVSMVDENKGAIRINFEIKDIEQKATLKVYSKKYKIDINSSVINYLEDLKSQEKLNFVIN